MFMKQCKDVSMLLIGQLLNICSPEIGLTVQKER